MMRDVAPIQLINNQLWNSRLWLVTTRFTIHKIYQEEESHVWLNITFAMLVGWIHLKFLFLGHCAPLKRSKLRRLIEKRRRVEVEPTTGTSFNEKNFKTCRQSYNNFQYSLKLKLLSLQPKIPISWILHDLPLMLHIFYFSCIAFSCWCHIHFGFARCSK